MFALLTPRTALDRLGTHLRNGDGDRPATALFRLAPTLSAGHEVAVFAGLDRVLRYLSALRVTDSEVAWLRSRPALREVLTEAVEGFLRDFRWRGDVDALPEGSVAPPGAPVLRLAGSAAEVGWVVSFVLAAVASETSVATAAAHAVASHRGASVVEDSLGVVDPASAAHVARAAWVGGCAGSTLEQAGFTFGVPVLSPGTDARVVFAPPVGPFVHHHDDDDAPAPETFRAWMRRGKFVADLASLETAAHDARERAAYALAHLVDERRWSLR